MLTGKKGLYHKHVKWNETPHRTNVTVNMRKPTNGICIIHYLKISVAIHALVHGFKFMKLKWLLLNILKAWHGGQSLTLMLLLLLVLSHLMLSYSGCRSPTKNSRSTCPCILNMAINYHVYFLHDIFLLFLI